MQQETKLLIEILCSAIADKSLQAPEDVNWTELYRLAALHGISALVWQGMKKQGIATEQIPAPVRQRFEAEHFRAVYRDTQMEFIKSELQKGFEKEEIPYVFLKGAQLKYAYPEPALRTMCDMDILVRTDDYDKITRIAKTFHGEPYYGDGNHHNFQFPGGVAVECHPNLIHPGLLVGTEMNPGWQYTENVQGKTERLMTPEGMYLHTLTHLADHFIAGGVGVRFVLDVWICNHRSKPYDREFVQKELKRFHLLDFAEKIEALAEVWFSDKETTPLLEELGEYILTSGSHGRTDRAMLNAVSLSPGGNRFSALWHKVFYPREELETRYPWSRGKPWLLPAAWCARAFGAVTQRGHLIRKWSSGTGEVTREAAEQQRRKLASFGITRNKDRK